jgi:hypothetical protein
MIDWLFLYLFDTLYNIKCTLFLDLIGKLIEIKQKISEIKLDLISHIFQRDTGVEFGPSIWFVLEGDDIKEFAIKGEEHLVFGIDDADADGGWGFVGGKGFELG